MKKIMYRITLLSVLLLFASCSVDIQDNYYFPPPGNHISHHNPHLPQEVGLNPQILEKISDFIQSNPYERSGSIYEPRWAIWRHGYLVHVEGDFYQKTDVASLRKTWHAMTVGAALKQGKIAGIDQIITGYLPELVGNDADATWEDVLTQSAGFDYPYDTFPDYSPGEMWTYSDWNLVHLNNALARVYGKANYFDHYDEVIREAYFNDIGMKGWESDIVRDASFGDRFDGVRFILNLEHMGRLGLLALARGRWDGKQLIPRSFVEALETKQTYGKKVNYKGPNDGIIGFNLKDFPESPYGYLTWVNTDQDYFKRADRAWASGSGAGGSRIIWNKNNGIVFAGFGINPVSGETNLPLIIENHIFKENPLLRKKPIPNVGQWSYFETSWQFKQTKINPYEDIEIQAIFRDSQGEVTETGGFYDGNITWKVRFMPSKTGLYSYQLKLKDGKVVKEGQFEVQSCDIPGLIHKYDKNPLWFGYMDGEPELIRSFHIGDRFTADTSNFITGEVWSKKQRRRVLDWFEEQGYNMLSIGSMFLNRQEEGRGEGWNTPDLWDSVNQLPNYREYQRLENVLEDLSIRKILAYPFAGFFGRSSDLPAEKAKKKLFLKYTLNRVGAYWNLLYMVGGPEPLLPKKVYMDKNEIAYWGIFIDSLDIYGHLLSCHNYTGDDIFKDEPWTDYGILQGPKTLDRKMLHEGISKNHHEDKPLYAQETLWPGNMYHPDYSLEDIRKNAIVLTMSGAMINYADMNGNSSSGFSGSMDFRQVHPEFHDVIKKVWDFFETIPFYDMKPCPDLANKGFCLARPDEIYLIYMPDGGEVEVALTDSRFDGQWINGKNLEKKYNINNFPIPAVFKTPDRGDWLLLLKKSKI
jgi:CubicO group peptidase (beta-lactamase class C family)